jgi:microbial collagenase
MRRWLVVRLEVVVLGALCCFAAGCGSSGEGATTGDCSDEVDNDEDGDVDCADSGCIGDFDCDGTTDDDDSMADDDDSTVDDDDSTADDDDSTADDDDSGADDDDSASSAR